MSRKKGHCRRRGIESRGLIALEKHQTHLTSSESWWSLILPLCKSFVVSEICYACMLSHFSRVHLFATLWTIATRLLCPWDSPDKNTGGGCHAFHQGIFSTQGSNQHLLHYITLPASPALAGECFTTSTTWEPQNMLELHPYWYPLEIQQIFSNWNIAVFDS